MTTEHEPGRTFCITPIKETADSITLQVSRSPDETVVFTYLPATREVRFQFIAGVPEPEKTPEHPEVTMEGRIAKDAKDFGGAKYDQEKHTFSVRIAHQYNPDNPQAAWYYNIVAEGEVAEEAYRLYLTTKGIPIRVGGWDISGPAKLDKGTKGVIKADFIERLPPGTKPRVDILPGRVRLSDIRAHGGN